MTSTQKLTAEQLRVQLFDALMEQIEPDLMIANHDATAEKLVSMTPAQRKATVAHYQDCYAQFMVQWPSFVQNAVQDIGQMKEEMLVYLKGTEEGVVEDIEHQISIS